jgi:hypothetical protein
MDVFFFELRSLIALLVTFGVAGLIVNWSL